MLSIPYFIEYGQAPKPSPRLFLSFQQFSCSIKDFSRYPGFSGPFKNKGTGFWPGKHLVCRMYPASFNNNFGMKLCGSRNLNTAAQVMMANHHY